MNESSPDKSVIRFAHLIAQSLVDLAQPKPGDRVLDVATGVGAVALCAAGKVLPNGQVVGIDLASPLLAHARQRLAIVGIPQVTLLEGELEQLRFADETFDCVFCSSAIFRLPDMMAGLCEWRRVLKPGGTVAFSGYGARRFQPLLKLFETSLRRYAAELPPQPFAWQWLTDLEAFRELLRSAGFSAIDVRSEQLGYDLAGGDEWWEFVWNSDFRDLLDSLTLDVLAQFKAEHLAAVTKLATAQGIWLNVVAIFAVGQKG
ncbi:MAG: class I SAM-dependent methyltransferase [Caldilineaceae bacterium]